MRPPEVFTQAEFIGVCRIQSTLAFFNNISPSEHEIMHCFFCWIPYSLNNSLGKFDTFLSTGSIGWKPAQLVQRISVEVHYSSRFKFGAPKLVLVISPTSELEIMHYLFFGFLTLQGTFYQIFRFFSQLDRPVGNCTADSSGQLAWSTVFVDFGAQILLGLGP